MLQPFPIPPHFPSCAVSCGPRGSPSCSSTSEAIRFWAQFFIVTRRRGTEMNRNTLTTAIKAGFRILEMEPVFLYLIFAAEAIRDPAPDAHGAVTSTL